MAVHQCEAKADTTGVQCTHSVDDEHERCAAGHLNARRRLWIPESARSRVPATAGAPFDPEDFWGRGEVAGHTAEGDGIFEEPEPTMETPVTVDLGTDVGTGSESAPFYPPTSLPRRAVARVVAAAKVIEAELRAYVEWRRQFRRRPSAAPTSEERATPDPTAGDRGTERAPGETRRMATGAGVAPRRRLERTRRALRWTAAAAWLYGTSVFREMWRVARWTAGGHRHHWRNLPNHVRDMGP